MISTAALATLSFGSRVSKSARGIPSPRVSGVTQGRTSPVTIDQLPSEVADALRIRLRPDPNVLASDKAVNQWLRSVKSSFVFREYCECNGLADRRQCWNTFSMGFRLRSSGYTNVRRRKMAKVIRVCKNLRGRNTSEVSKWRNSRDYPRSRPAAPIPISRRGRRRSIFPIGRLRIRPLDRARACPRGREEG